ncbi:hypothetical protein Vafri_11700 [Volvox africanus]|uniref:Ammonium transporter n=1 Tax=Volvox africanus TaxID=51714 RepID=A0A8J4B8K8_9CHLO|nr:hypothetical protein Vafri_11700 [Volvox africanus]
MNTNISCPQDILNKLHEALHSLPNSGELALAICVATGHSGLQDKIDAVSHGLNQLYLLFGTALVFVMHGGFAMLAAGAIRSKNAVNILLQTLMDACASALMWYLIGFGFAYGIGDKPNVFIGDALFAFARVRSHNTGSDTGRWLDIVFQWAFCATAVTIPAGSVAERCNFNAYLCYSSFISAFLYPVVAHWVWCSEGWLGYGTLKPLLNTGMMDFAGSSVVHMLGGLSGLAGATLLGPRMGRFDIENQPVPLPGHSAVLVVLGTILLWFGWYGFNPASTLVIDTALAAEVASRSAVTTTLGGAAGGVGCLAWTLLRTRTFDLYALCNGVLCGFVAVTAGCHVFEPWAAILCGAGAGIIFDLASLLLLKFGVDDPLGAAPMHGGCGAYGVLFTGLLAKKEYVMQSYTSRKSYPHGIFYGGGGRLLACQVIGVLVIAGWTLGLMFPFFWILKRFKLLRVPPEEELQGLDISRHNSRAYYMDQVQDPSFTPPLATYTNGAMGTIAFIKKGNGAVGDALMRAELMNSPPPQHKQQIAASTTTANTSAWAGSPRASIIVMADKSGRFGSARHYQVPPPGAMADSTPDQTVRVGTKTLLEDGLKEPSGADADSSTSEKSPQPQALAPSQRMESQRSGNRNLDVQQGQQMQRQMKAPTLGPRLIELQTNGDVGTNGQLPGAPSAAVVTLQDSTAASAAGDVNRSPSAASAGRILAGSRSSKNAVAPLGGGGGWGSLGVSGAFEDGADISVHRLTA